MDNAKLLQIILDIGQAMLECGSEVSRAEDSIYRMCMGYDMKSCDIFGLPSILQVTVETRDEEILTQVRHVGSAEYNFDRLDYLNDLSRYIVEHCPDVPEIRGRLEEIMARPRLPLHSKFIASMIAAGCLAVFFGGTLSDGIVSALIAGIYVACVRLFLRLEDNSFVFNFVASLIMAVLAFVFVRLGFGEHTETIIIGDCMLLIAGAGLTNGMRDILKSDVISGILNVINSLMGAAAIAFGVAAAMIVGSVI